MTHGRAYTASRCRSVGVSIAALRVMATRKQKTAARRNIKKAASAAKRKRTIANLPKKTRSALGKQASKVARSKR